MRKKIVLAGLMLGILVGSPAPGYAQGEDIRVKEQTYADLKTLLNASIALGWTPDQVFGILGAPDRRSSFFDGPDAVEVWGYRGFDVRIEFRNGLVSDWFFRFMR